jgi:uncharacterized phosphosugar-binding protein
MSAEAYFDAAERGLRRLRETQGESLAAAADLFTEAIAGGRALFAFGATHSFALAAELVYRTGGLVLVNPLYPHAMDLSVRPLTQTSQTERLEGLGRIMLENSPARAGDVILLASVSGRNAVVLDMALAARERGLKIVGVTSVEYSQAVSSRHSSGKRLLDLCDVVIDNCAPLGDAAVAVPGEAQKTGPLSTVLGCAAVNAVVAQTVANLVARGVQPPIFMSANLDGGDERNARLMAEYADRIHYM